MPALVFFMAALVALPTSAKDPRLIVFAAASLKESLDAVASDWTRRGGKEVTIAYAASSALSRQIEQGAPANVFIAADRESMDSLQRQGLIVGASRFDLVRNALVLVAPATSRVRTVTLESTTLLQALGDGRLAVAETSSVPAGRYAGQALSALGAWPSVSTRLAQADNVRAALAFVARGEAPLGIVYATDARAEPKVRVVAIFPESTHQRIVYPAARMVAGNAAASDAFLAYLQTEAARRIFVSYGFRRP